MSSLHVLVVALGAILPAQKQQVGSIQQRSSAPCTVNSAAMQGGTVTINCPGVDPRAMRVFNDELKKQGHDIKDLADKLKSAEAWRSKYEELNERLAAAGLDSELARKADEFLKEGRLDEAKKALDQLIKDDEKQIDRVAQDYFNRGYLNQLQFDHLLALDDYERAYRYRPDNTDYALAYGSFLLEQHQLGRAEEVLGRALLRLHTLARTDPNAYQPKVAATLNNLAILYSDTQRPKEAEDACKAALDIYGALDKTNPNAYQPDVAETLNNLAFLYWHTQRLKEAESSFKESVDIFRVLAKANPNAYQPDVAEKLYNLATFYKDVQRLNEAEDAYREALEIYRDLAKANPSIYQPKVERTLKALSSLADKAEQ